MPKTAIFCQKTCDFLEILKNTIFKKSAKTTLFRLTKPIK